MIRSLTGLRFYAALLVFISHFWLYGYFVNLYSGPLFTYMDEIGWAGVSIFFTLSGFVLFINYLDPQKNRPLHLRDFYVARLARIYPVFLIGLLAAIPLQLLSPQHKPFWTPLFLNLSLLHCFEEKACSAFNLVGWSLSSEFVFYLLFPFLATLFTFQPFHRVGVVLALYLTYIVSLTTYFPDSFYAYVTFPPNRVGEFLLGMLAGHLYLKYQNNAAIGNFVRIRYMNLLLFVLILGLIALMTVEPLIIAPYPELERIGYLDYTLPSMLIILILAFLEKHEADLPLFSHPWIVYFGEISYSFYIIHHLLMRYVGHVAKMLFGFEMKVLGLAGGIPVAMILFGASMGCASLMYRYIEKPWRKKIITFFQRQPEITITIPEPEPKPVTGSAF